VILALLCSKYYSLCFSTWHCHNFSQCTAAAGTFSCAAPCHAWQVPVLVKTVQRGAGMDDLVALLAARLRGKTISDAITSGADPRNMKARAVTQATCWLT
jgi:hypothetical protein